MTAHAYTEDQLVEQPAIGLSAELGWQTVSAMEEVFGPYTKELFAKKSEVLFEHVYKAYLGEGESVYSNAA